MIYNVAIIGGGLAGLALSIDLRRKGYEVIVLEKGNYPRHKVCGEYISMESYNYLLGICPSLLDISLPIISKFRLTSTSKNDFITSLDLGGFGVSRYILEDLLFNEAKKIGVHFMLNTKAIDIQKNGEMYSVKTNNADIFASTVCNSSGRKSNFETKEKTNPKTSVNYVGIKYHIKMDRDPALIEIHNFPGGYCGISNIEDGKSCLCYIVNADKLKEAKNSIADMEKNILHKNNNLKQIFNEAEFLFKEPVTISGINFLIKKSVDVNCILLGDASGSVAPITGNGMSMALRSSYVLSQLIDNYFSKAISHQQLIEQYQIFWNKEFSIRIKLSRHLQKLSENTSLTNMTISIFNMMPVLATNVIKLTHGKPF
jgi:flavin-dependent dehydrogenase